MFEYRLVKGLRCCDLKISLLLLLKFKPIGGILLYDSRRDFRKHNQTYFLEPLSKV